MANDALDRIYIRDLAVRCIVGIYPEERREKQDVVVNITLFADLRRAGASDDLGDTVDYRAVKKAVIGLVEASQYQLVERLAERIAEVCLAHAGVLAVSACWWRSPAPCGSPARWAWRSSGSGQPMPEPSSSVPAYVAVGSNINAGAQHAGGPRTALPAGAT